MVSCVVVSAVVTSSVFCGGAVVMLCPLVVLWCSLVVLWCSLVVLWCPVVVMWYPAVVLWCGDGAVAMAVLSCSVAVPW